jgi:Antitoxin Xre/MbcA/ParS C-terminal toxin-binding domain
METTRRDYPQVLLTGPGAKTQVPAWIRGRFSPKVATAHQIRRLLRLPQLTVVRASEPESVLKAEGFLSLLADRLHHTPVPAKILFVFDTRRRRTNPRTLLQVLSHFDRTEAVEFARGAEQACLALDSAVAKIWADLPEQAPAPATDLLGRLKSVIAATADLRSESGRLSARKVAEAMGLPLSQLAAAIGKPRQSVWKTDDAEAIQERLLPFERVARLRAVLSKRDFLSWLNMANDQLDGRTPIDLLRVGRADLVADLAEDMLTGSPV